MTGYIAMRLETDSGPVPLWQQVVDGMAVAYLDAFGQPVTLPATYEMVVMTGDLLEAPL